MRIDLAEVKAIEDVEDHKTKVFRAALMYISQGIPVIPIPYGEKHVNNTSIYTSRCSARKDKITEWFHPDTGRYAGWNIAIGCGDYYGKGGVFAIDVDNKYHPKYGKDIWGTAAWDSLLEAHGGLQAVPVQSTPSGGKHVLLAWKENLTPSQNRLANGIDTRGGHPNKISSHIMAFPSVVDGKGYEWIAGGDIHASPEWIDEAMGIAWRKRDGEGRGNEGMRADDVETLVSLQKVSSLLDALDPNVLDYEQWLKVGQAIHSQHCGPDALDLWDDWSQRGERYEAGECHVRWKGFKQNGPVRMATLFYIVQQCGTPSMVPEDQGGDESFVSDSVDEYNRRYALVLSGENVKVARKEQVLGSIQHRFKLYSIDAFRSFFMNDVIMVQNEKGAEKPIRKFDIWMASPRRNSFDGMILKPDMGPTIVDSTGLTFLNTWAGFAVEAVEGEWDLLKKHIYTNLCDSNQVHYDWLMDWMADMFQEPSNPKGTAVVLGGIEGAGKGTLANALAHIFGLHASIISNGKHLNSQFNDMIMDSVFLFADEVVYAGNHETANVLKAMVTEKTNTREQKFGSKEKVESFLHIMMSTNNDWKVAAGPESRRWFVLKVLDGVANNREYFGAIKRQMENGGYEAMLFELLGREVLSNLRYAPVTQELKAQRTMMQVQSLYDSLPAWIAFLLDSGNLGIHDVKADMNNEGTGWPSVVEKASLWETYAEWSRKYKSKVAITASSVFYTKMTLLGFTEGTRVRRKNDRVRSINVPSLKELADKAMEIYAIESPIYDEGEQDE